MSDWERLKTLKGQESALQAAWPEIVDLLSQWHMEKDTWATLPPCYWLARLTAEVGELAAAIADKHEHPWELEAAQVASIALSMLKVHGLPLAALIAEEERSPGGKQS